MASTYLSKTFSSDGNRKTFTISFWLKKCKVPSSAYYWILGTGTTTSDSGLIYFDNDNNHRISIFNSSGDILRTSRAFRDTNAWYHIVYSVDTTQATSSDRVKLYVNGVQETSFVIESYPAQNTDMNFNRSQSFDIGRDSRTTGGTGAYLDGSLAHFHFIDGTAYDADDFGETDSTTGEWKPKTSPSVTYGTNGFFLKFENASSFGEDSSGNDNDFTSNGSPTQLVDTPTNVLATFNPLDKATSVTLSNCNTKAVCATANTRSVNSTLAVSKGKWYAEIEFDAGTAGVIGVISTKFSAIRDYTTKAHQYSGSGGGVFYLQGNQIYVDGVDTSDADNSYTTGDIIGIALNLDDDEITFYKNGTSQATITSKTFDDDGYYFAVTHASGSGSSTYLANFGNGYFGTTAVTSGNQDDAGYGTFEYEVPSGYYTLNTKNINTYG